MNQQNRRYNQTIDTYRQANSDLLNQGPYTVDRQSFIDEVFTSLVFVFEKMIHGTIEDLKVAISKLRSIRCTEKINALFREMLFGHSNSRNMDLDSVTSSLIDYSKNSVNAVIVESIIKKIKTHIPSIRHNFYNVSNNANERHLFKRYWTVTPETFEAAMRTSIVSVSTLDNVIFHPDDIRYPLYIPTIEGSYMYRKQLDYNYAYGAPRLL